MNLGQIPQIISAESRQDALKYFYFDIKLKCFEMAFFEISKLMQILFSPRLKSRLDNRGTFPVEGTT